MKRTLVPLIFIAVSIALHAFQTTKGEHFTLTVTVNKLRNSKGVVQFALYNKDGSIPDEDYTQEYKLIRSNIENHSARAVFTNLPKGKYAVNILHDENKDGKIDKGLLLPNEGIGFSNFSTIGLSNRPNFEKAAFLLKENRTINVNIIYF